MSKASEWLEKHKATEAARNRAIEEAGAAHPEVPPPSFVHDGKYNVFVDDCGFLRCNYMSKASKYADRCAAWERDNPRALWNGQTINPPEFIGPIVMASANSRGRLNIYGHSCGKLPEDVTPEEAVRLARWILDTFGEPEAT